MHLYALAMRKKIAKTIPWIYFFLVVPLASAKATHLETLKSHYPYGLIGDDYGILTEEDLAVNTCNTSQIAPFVEGKNMTYSYWQCFPLTEAKMQCDTLGFDVVSKKETGHLEVEIQNAQGIQSYLARDAMDMRECKRYMQYWKQKTQGEKYVCVSGSYGRLEEITNGHQEMDWIFDKFKTRKGCESHRSECSLKEVSKEIIRDCKLTSNMKLK